MGTHCSCFFGRSLEWREEKKDRPLLINNKQFIRPNPVETESPEEDQKSQFLHVLFLTQC